HRDLMVFEGVAGHGPTLFNQHDRKPGRPTRYAEHTGTFCTHGRLNLRISASYKKAHGSPGLPYKRMDLGNR
ncbi:hypothetical protein, partial [Pseudomonas sp. SIMBA_068]|uniref:hypothetical protein n=1 Tax=Pseudomonas sp. SIMBA_068 TaxID=3085808 RepID=UPI00397B2035